MLYYMYKNKMIISEDEYTNKNFKKVTEEEVKGYSGTIYALTKMEPLKSNRAFLVPREDYLFLKKEDISFLQDGLQSEFKAPAWLKNAIENHRVISLNTSYPDFLDALEYTTPKKWRINVVGLGDVGSTLLTGLKLLGKDSISQLGIYDLDNRKVQRMNFELSQIMSCSGEENSIAIKMLDEASLFDCDMFVFCVSVYVPPVGKENCDVRMIQYEGNRKILNHYGTLARKAQFKGIFSVVSDPVDMLSRSLFDFTNRDSSGNYDFKGLAAEQIRGYGLGVMNARAAYYDSLTHKSNYPKEGRAFGPHGEGLIIANSIKNYDDKISRTLTQKTKTANLDIRETGFKPYIAPALSSGALSILDTINGRYHYSAIFIDGLYMGCRNKFINGYSCHEILPLPRPLFTRIEDTFRMLNDLYNSN